MSQVRNARANMVSRAVEGRFGWVRDPFDAPGAGETWEFRFPGLPLVADGREKTGFTRAGRGTTAFDLFRSVKAGGPSEGRREYTRIDFLSLKSDTIADDNKLPSKIELATGNPDTLAALCQGLCAGAALPTLLFCSRNDPAGDPEPEGVALFVDVGPIIRGGIADIENGPYARGQAPPAYFKWSSGRACGGKSKGDAARGELEFPHVDSQGRKWLNPSRVCYPELVVSLASLGIRRDSWTPIHVRDIPKFLESQNWGGMSF